MRRVVLLAGWLALGPSFLVLAVVAASSDTCYCDGWQSTATASPFSYWSDPLPGKSYAGVKNTTRGGLRCVPWKEAFERCKADGNSAGGPMYAQMLIDVAEDKLFRGRGLHSSTAYTKAGDAIPENACYNPKIRYGSVWQGRNDSPDFQMWAWKAPFAEGPWCFVEESDYIKSGLKEPVVVPDGPGGSGVFPEELRTQKWAPPCGNLRRLSCDVPQCPAPKSCISTQTAGKMLVANGGFEDWRQPSARWRQDPLSDRNNPYPETNPLDVMHWEYIPWSLKMGQWGRGAPATLPLARYVPSFPGMRNSTLVTKQLTRDRGTRSDEEVGAEPAHAKFTLRGEPFVFRSQLGAVASVVAGARYRLSANVRCQAGENNVVVGLGMATLQPLPAPGKPMEVPDGIWAYWAHAGPLMKPLDVVANSSTSSTFAGRADEVALTFLDCSRAENQVPTVAQNYGWLNLWFEFTPTVTSRDTQVQFSFGDAAKGKAGGGGTDADSADKHGREGVKGVVELDKVELSRVDSDDAPATCTFENWQCREDKFNMVYRLREEGNVPMTLDQLSRLAQLRIDSRQCRVPDAAALAKWMDPVCPFMKDFPLPHAGSKEVSEKLKSMTDRELEGAMGWKSPDEEFRNELEYVRLQEDIPIEQRAVTILRQTFAEAAEAELFRVVGGPEYGSRWRLDLDYGLTAQPLRSHLWFSLAATDNGAYFSDGKEHECKMLAGLRPEVCYLEAITSFAAGCIFPALLLDTLKAEPSFDGIFRDYQGRPIDSTLIRETFGPRNDALADRVLQGKTLAVPAKAGDERGLLPCAAAIFDATSRLKPTTRSVSGESTTSCGYHLHSSSPFLVLFLQSLENSDEENVGCLTSTQNLNYTQLNLKPWAGIKNDGTTTDNDKGEWYEDHLYLGLLISGGLVVVCCCVSLGMRVARWRQQKHKDVYLKGGHILPHTNPRASTANTSLWGSIGSFSTWSAKSDGSLLHSWTRRSRKTSTSQQFSSNGIDKVLMDIISDTGVPLLRDEDFEFTRTLGKGAHGLVYEAKWKKGNVPVAVKSLQLFGIAEDEVARNARAMATELAVLNAVRHPCVIYIYGAVVAVDPKLPGTATVRIIMELADCSLQDLLKCEAEREKKDSVQAPSNTPSPGAVVAAGLGLSLATRLGIVESMALGILHLHSGKFPVVHRDLKPGNIMIRRRGNSLEACISDFGIAQLNKTDMTLGSPATYQPKGTLMYMAPEIINPADGAFESPSRLDLKAADVYSLGCTILQVLAHRPLDVLQDTSIMGNRAGFEQLENRLGEKAPSVKLLKRHFVEGVTKNCMEVVSACLHPRPEERPQMEYVAEVFAEARIRLTA